MRAILTLFRPIHAAKFLSVMKRDGFGEAVRRARYYAGIIFKNQGRSEFRAGQTNRARDGFHGFWEHTARENAFHISSMPAVLSRRRKIAVIGDLNLPQCRKYRVEQLDELWGTKDIDVEHSHYEDFHRAAHIMQGATHLILYRLTSSLRTADLLYEAHRLRLPVAYDIDDPLFSVSAYATYGNAERIGAGLRTHFLEQAPTFSMAMNACDIVSVSTPFLAEHTRLYSNRPVHVRRNFADGETLDAGRRAILRSKRNSGAEAPFTVAFASGSMGREADFDTVVTELEQFICAKPGRRFMILGEFPWSYLSPRLAARTVTRPFKDYPQYMASLAEADCAIVPLKDDIFNRCKSGVRVIDAAAVAVPALVPPVGDARTMIEEGKTGRVISATGGWIEALEDLAADRRSTENMGKNAREHLVSNWSAVLRTPIIDTELLDWVIE